MKIYIAGQISDNSHFDAHDWRREFFAKLKTASGLNLESIDPFMFSTRDEVCRNVREVAAALKKFSRNLFPLKTINNWRSGAKFREPAGACR